MADLWQMTRILHISSDLQGRLSETPGVKSMSYSFLPLLIGNLMMTGFHWPGTPQDRESEANVLTSIFSETQESLAFSTNC
jgi:hypothetical protein